MQKALTKLSKRSLVNQCYRYTKWIFVASLISLISIPHVAAYATTNSTSPCPIRGSTLHCNSTGATSTPSINSMDYKHGYQFGLSLAKNCIYHTVLNRSNLFNQGISLYKNYTVQCHL